MRRSPSSNRVRKAARDGPCDCLIGHDALRRESIPSRGKRKTPCHQILLGSFTMCAATNLAMSAPIFVGGFGRSRYYRKRTKRPVRCMQILQRPSFVTIYAKSLISQVGT